MMNMSVLGDTMPASLAAYYRYFDAGRLDDAVRNFSDDALYAVPAPTGSETDPRLQIHGRSALLTSLKMRGPRAYVHEPLVCVRDGSSCLLEAAWCDRTSGRAVASFVTSLQLDADGLIERCLAYLCAPAVDAPAAAEDGDIQVADAMTVVERYFAALDAGAFVDAAACFSADVVYSQPPYRHTGIDGNQRVQFDGRAALLEAFKTRGHQSFAHRVLASAQRGSRCIFEGIVEGLPGGETGSFISSLTLDPEGRIQRYLSFYCEPSVPRR